MADWSHALPGGFCNAGHLWRPRLPGAARKWVPVFEPAKTQTPSLPPAVRLWADGARDPKLRGAGQHGALFL